MAETWSTRLLLRIAKRLQREGTERSRVLFPGQITVAGKQITALKPLGNPFTPGMTKAGRLSFQGVYEGQPVKVYSAYSIAQVGLRQAVQSLSQDNLSFPQLIAVDERIVVEEWIDGRSANQIDTMRLKEVEQRVQRFFYDCQTSVEFKGIASSHQNAFCYFNNYLLSRLSLWRELDAVKHFVDNWKEHYTHISESIPRLLSHPDLSAANLIYESRTGRLVSIDNELLGVGHGWLLDKKNSLLSDENSDRAHNADVALFVEMTWRLRKLGSALDRHNFEAVNLILSSV